MQDDDAIDLEPPRSLRQRVLSGVGTLLISVAVSLAVMVAYGRFRGPDLPGEAPSFVGFDLKGNQVTLADYAGKTVVLNFWATWCGPCRIEAPSFSSFANAHPDVVVLGLAVDGPPGKVARVSRDIGITYPVVMVGPSTEKAYQVAQLPTTVIVNPDGTVRWAHAGMLFRPQLAWLTGHLW